MLEHPTRYQWARVEADEAGLLDDVIALRTDGSLIARQVKFSTDPESEGDAWTWQTLLKKRKGKTEELPSLLEKWASSLEQLRKAGPIREASVFSNRKASLELQTTLLPNGLIDFDRIANPDISDEVIRRLGGEARARSFFTEFHFFVDRPGIDLLEDSLRRRFYALGGKEQGWLNLKDGLRSWIRNRNQPPPDGAITLGAVRSAAQWYQLQSLPQQFEIPTDFVLPSQDFHRAFVRDLLALRQGCVVLTASPGVGKSTYLSFLHDQLAEQRIPVIRHHYFLSLSDRTVGRLDHHRVAESLMRDIQGNYAEALGELGTKNPDPVELNRWIEAIGQHFAERGDSLIAIIDGLDHVWREQGSIDELNKLFEHLLPTPDGVVILLGMQPVDETQLPSRLIHSAPRGQWKELPLLDRHVVKQWLQAHEGELGLPQEQHARESLLDRLADIFYGKSQGHPLHLRYTLKALQEQDVPVTEENINRLPGCPHQDITEYYKDLWFKLPEEGREILHLFAACPFPWPPRGITETLDPQRARLPQVNNALRLVKHLMVQDALGLRPFHSSIPVFIRDQPDHSVYSQRVKQGALEWLRTAAPDYWRWAYAWWLAADLGNDQPLINGPTRRWAVEAITKRFPRQEASVILAQSGWTALQHKDLPRCVEVGLLRDYFESAYEHRSEILDKLLYPQLILEEDSYIRARLLSNIVLLTETELTLLAENESSRGNQSAVHACRSEVIRLLKEYRSSYRGEISDYKSSRMEAVMKMAALGNDIDPAKVFAYIIQYRRYGWSHRAFETFSQSLRTLRNVSPLRKILKMEMTALERSHVLKHAVLLALEEELDLNQEICLAEHGFDPFAAIYAVLHKVTKFKREEIRLPSAQLLSLKEYEHYSHRGAIEDVFYTVFFCLLGNHLLQEAQRNKEWLRELGDDSWPRSFLRQLDAIASELAPLLLSGDAPSFGWFYGQVKRFDKPTWPKDRDVYEYAISAQRAIDHIGLDIMILAKAVGKNLEIVREDLELAFSSSYCHPWDWMDVYVARRRKSLVEETLEWLLQEQAESLGRSIELFSGRASKYTTLASLAALHGLGTAAGYYIREAASNLISYGDHKDVLLFGALEIVETCHKANLPEARQWLLQLAPAIARVENFTDGDETGSLPRVLADVLAEVAPDLLPPYYEWLCGGEDYYDALSAFHAFLRTADLSDEINQALARTALDDESLAILVERVMEEGPGAKAALLSMCQLLGQKSIDRIKAKKVPDKPIAEDRTFEEGLPRPGDYPPDRLVDYLSAAEGSYLFRREGYVKRWLEFWRSANRGEEAFSSIEKEVGRGVELGNYDALFDLALSLYGRDRAYPWLVKAHIRGYGWDRYFSSREQALRRWQMVKEHYPDQWLGFIRDTMRHSYGEPWRDLSIYNRFVRLGEYCLFMRQTELARQVSGRVIASTAELVSPLSLPTPGWVNKP